MKGYKIPSIKLSAWFHAYVLCSVIGIRWGKYTPTSANSNSDLKSILYEYLNYACKDNEWEKTRILEAIRFKTGAAIKAEARIKFPSLFPKRRKAHPLSVPDELTKENINFDIEKVNQWKQQVREIKRELTMNEDGTIQEVLCNTDVDTNKLTEEVKPAQANKRVTLNFLTPPGVDVNSITIDNYKELTGKRFRMTREQMSRGISREVAFEESKSLAISKQQAGK